VRGERLSDLIVWLISFMAISLTKTPASEQDILGLLLAA
jgi:hypothetical protein